MAEQSALPPTDKPNGTGWVKKVLALLLAAGSVCFIAAPMPMGKLAHPPADAGGPMAVANQADAHPADDPHHHPQPRAHQPPPHDPLEPLHRAEVRASLVFAAFSGYRLLACVVFGLCGRKVKVTLVVVTLAVGAAFALAGWWLTLPLLIVAGGFTTMLGHTLHHVEGVVGVDEGVSPPDDPSPPARIRRSLGRVGASVRAWWEKLVLAARAAGAAVRRWWREG